MLQSGFAGVVLFTHPSVKNLRNPAIVHCANYSWQGPDFQSQLLLRLGSALNHTPLWRMALTVGLGLAIVLRRGAEFGHKQSFILDALPPIFSWTNADSSGSK